MTSLTSVQLDCLKDALNTFECISFEMPSDKNTRFEIIGKWHTIRRMLSEVINSNEYFEDLENSPYLMPYEWGEKLFLTKNKTVVDIISEVLELAWGLSPALDSDAACFRVFNRMLAEFIGKDLRPYRLLHETGELTPKYCKDPL